MTHRHAPILWLAALGDVDVRHDLEPRDDAVLNVLGCALHDMQNTIDAVTHHELVFAGLDMNVRRVVLDALADEQVDETHNGSIVIGRLGDLHRVGGSRRLVDNGCREVVEFAVRAHESCESRTQI